MKMIVPGFHFLSKPKTPLCYFSMVRAFSSGPATHLKINERYFETDDFTNITPRILKLLNKKLYLKEYHPLSFVKQRIVNYFLQNFKGRTGNSYFSIHEQLDPIVTTHQNFDSLLVPKDHASRSKSDCYYVNRDTLLRAHMTAHQSELIKMGLNNFLMVGDVYRRDEIDSSHYPVFHQLDAVRLFTANELFLKEDDGQTDLSIRRKVGERTGHCQEAYTKEASARVTDDIKKTLNGLSRDLFGKNVPLRWVPAYFPFTHPSFELEILLNNIWVEVLGCGVIEHKILEQAGCGDRIGWAFGLGLERLAMIQYNIPDIRIFWSEDTGFLCQFQDKTPSDCITYKPVSSYPQCKNHLSFWIPPTYSPNDFYDLVRDICGDHVEQVHLIDVFDNGKGCISHCYEIIYRHPDKTFVKDEVNAMHKNIASKAEEKLMVKVR